MPTSALYGHNLGTKFARVAGVAAGAHNIQDTSVMALTFHVVSSHKAELGEDQEKSIGTEGATIGRSLSNDWVLPDSKRYVSSRHATVDYQSGSYYLIDTSTNGVFINGSETPVGAGKPQRLFNGDKLSIGDYQITTEITESGELDSIEEMISSIVLEQSADVVGSDESPSMLEENALTGAKSLNARLFADSDSTGELMTTTLSPADTGLSNVIELASSNGALRARENKPTETAPPVRKREEKPTLAVEPSAMGPNGHKLRGEAGAQLEFLRGLGITMAELGNPNPSELMLNAGQALREFIIGTMDLLQNRAAVKNEFRLEQTTIQAGTNNPLKFSASIDDAIRNLLANKSRQYAPTVETVRDVCKDVKVHEQALAHAARSAFDEFVDKLEPEELESRFSGSLKRGSMFGKGSKSKYWDMYAELYNVITQRTPGQFPHTFVEDFVSSYEQFRRAADRPRESRDAQP